MKECDDGEWEKYLENFKKEKINDTRLQFVDMDDKDLWQGLIPEAGVRFQFIANLKENRKETNLALSLSVSETIK